MKKQKKIKDKKVKTDYMRLFVNLYFVLQYLTVHLIYFGFTIEPVALLPKVITAFYWEDILGGIWKFGELFVDGVTFGSAALLVLLCIPYSIYFIWQCKYVIIYFVVLFQLVWCGIIRLRITQYNRRISLENVAVVKIGAPGTGKTSSGLYDAVTMARKMWAMLRWKYFTYSSKVIKWEKDPIKYEQRLKEWDEIKFSFNYFKNNKCIPCLLTNNPVRLPNGLYASECSIDHLQQTVRAPAYSILFYDEVGALLDVDMVKERMTIRDIDTGQVIADISNFFRYCRHFGDFRIICTEQRSGNIFIDVRNVVSKNIWMLSQKWVLKPYLFIALFFPLKFICMKFVKRNNDGARRFNKFFAPLLLLLDNLVHGIGFRKYRYKVEGGEQGQSSEVIQGKRTFYLPSMLNFHYNSRAYQNFYKCKETECRPKIYTKDVLDDTEENRRKVLRTPRQPKIKNQYSKK